ncbi:MAG: SusD/RagB family nutrient-binding outer membrane lipoprotein [Ferruginibacter sp.]|nr:SusD/RagB family nutrient-binding outer membrane lipoprotein [Ferruginibacter sp.]
MKLNHKNWLLAVCCISMVACNKKIEDISVNPNQATKVPPNLLLVKQLNDLSGGLNGIEPWGAVSRYNQFHCRNYQYYGNNFYSFTGGPFNVYNAYLKNIDRMETEALNVGAPAVNPYSAIAKFLKSYYYYNLTSLMGDVPMSEAIKGLEGQFSPKYDDQKAVFSQILRWLDEANDDFSDLNIKKDKSLVAASDIFYGGDLTKWQKLVNTFKLRILISLSKKVTDADLKIATRFNDVITNTVKYPVFISVTDDFKFIYLNDVSINRYPTNPSTFGFDVLRLNMAETYVKSCTDLKDPRVLLTSEPAWKFVDSLGYAPTDFRAFVGSPTGQDQNIMETNALNGKLSLINRYRYYRTNVGENFIIVGYTEMCFNIAEAINRGFITGNAEDWYKKGIQSSLNFYGIADGTNTVNYLRPGQSLGAWTPTTFNFNFATYYAQPVVQYETGTPGLNKILLQKYIAFFQNSGWEAYYNFRRTGVPAFSGGVGIGNNGLVPVRWSYPTTEQNNNAANWKAAVDKQFTGADNLNGQMWILK